MRSLRLTRAVALIAAWAMLAGELAHSADAPQPANEALRYRRIYAPSDAVEDWPRGSFRYVPVEPKEFERLVEAVGAQVETAGALPRLSSARYHATLRGDTLVDGSAVLEVHRGEEGAGLMALAPFSLAVSRTAWTGSTEAPLLGARADGTTMLLVKESGSLEFDWSLRGQSDSSGVVAFALELPPAPRNVLELDLPVEVSAVPSVGLAEAEPAAGGRRLWRIELGGQHRFSLRIAPSDPVSQRRRLPLVRTATNYEFSTRGIDVSSTWRFEVQHEPLRRLELMLDRGLRLTGAKYGETPLVWTSEAAADGSSRLVIDLAEPVRGVSRSLRLSAVAPLVLDERLVLPRLRPQELAWQEGSLALLVPAPLELERLSPVLCRQSKTGPLPAPLVGDSIELECFGPEATTEVVVSRTRAPVQATMATSIVMGSDELSSVVTADLELAMGERFSLGIDVPQPWIVDGVATVPEDALGDWTLSNPSGGVRNLLVRLAKPLTKTQGIQLLLYCRSRSPLAIRTLSPSDLEVARLRGVRTQRQLLALATTGDYQLKLDGDELERLDPTRLSAADSRLFVEPPRGVVVSLSPRVSQWSVSVQPRRARLTADVQLSATVTRQQVREDYLIRTTTDVGSLDRLLVYFTQARPSSPRWSLAEGRPGHLATRKLTSAEQAAANLPEAGESWEVSLLSSLDSPLELRIERETPLAAGLALSLAAVPEAATQLGSATIFAAGDVPLEVIDRQLEPMQPNLADPAMRTDMRAAFRYDPSHESSPELAPALRVACPDKVPSSAGAVVWSCRIDTRAEPGGRLTHEAELRVRNVGQDELTLTLPEHAELLGLALDDRPESATRDGRRLVVALPAEREFVVVRLTFACASAEWGPWGALSAPQLEADAPILARPWMLWLPPEYELATYAVAGRDMLAARRDVVHRLFGPLARDTREPPFDPGEPDAWAEMFLVTPAETQALAHARQILELWGAKRPDDQAASGLATWLECVEMAGRAPGENRPLLLDRRALGDAGIGPDTPVVLPPTDAETSSLATGAALCDRAGVVLLVDPRALIITTRTAAAVAQGQLLPQRGEPLLMVVAGTMRRQIEAALAQDPSRFVSAARWKSEPRGPWNAESAGETSDNAGWVAWRLEGTAAAGQITVVRRSMLTATTTLVFLVTAIVGWWRARRRTRVLGAWALAFATAALLAPELASGIFSGGLLGLLACLLGCFVVSPREPQVRTARQEAVSRVVHSAAVATAVIVAVIVFARALDAAELSPPVPGRVVPREAYAVFIPADDQGRPTGERYKVPEPFYAELRRRASEALGKPHGALLKGANYEATLVRSASPMGLDVSELVARFELHVFDVGTPVRIPLAAQGLAVLPATARLDGRTIDIAWDSSRAALEFVAGEPGDYRLEVALKPLVQSKGDGSSVELSIPRLPTTKVDVHLPPQIHSVELLGAIGQTNLREEHQTLTSWLGTTDRLAIRWPHAVGSGRAPTFDADELLWLKVRPGSIVLDVRIGLKVQAGQLGELELVADPRLRLLPAANSDWRLVDARPLTDQGSDARVLRFAPLKPVADQATFQASFLLTGTSALGNVRVPRLETLAGRGIRRWLAVSVDPNLEYDLERGERIERIDPVAFAASWAPGTVAPQLAIEWSRGESNWSVAARPRQPRTTAHQALALSFYRGGLDVALKAELVTEGHTFEHRILAPKGLEITSLSLSSDGLEQAARWGRDATGTITVFLNEAVSGTQQLTLSGTLRTQLNGALALPIVRLEEAHPRDTLLTVTRRDAVTLKLSERTGLADAGPAAAPREPLAPGERLVASLVVTADQPQARVLIEPNQPRAKVVQLTTLRREGSVWQVSVESQWNVTRGVLDALRFEIPPSWTGPFTVEPAADVQLIELPGERRRHLIVRPRAAVTDAYRAKIVGLLAVASGDAVALPDVVPLNVERADRFVRLPRQVGLQNVTWETSQLKAAPLAKGFDSSPLDEATRTYRVTGLEPLARLKSVEHVADSPHVRLAEVRIAWSAEGRSRGLATFDIEPADSASCLVELPTECRLWQATVEGLCATPLPAGERQWRIPLLDRQFPQRVSLLFEAPLSAESSWGAAEIPAPVISGMPTDRTLFSIAAPPTAGAGEVLRGKSLGAANYELACLGSLSAMLNLPSDRASAARASDVRAWYQVRLRSWRSTRDELRRQATSSMTLTTEIATLQRECGEAAERLGTTDLWNANPSGPEVATEPNDLWTLTEAAVRAPVRGMFAGPIMSVAVRYPRRGEGDFVERLWLVLLGAAVVMLWLLAERQKWPLGDWLRRWPHAVGVILGLAWWLWLTPSVVGLLVAVGCALHSTRSNLNAAGELAATLVRRKAT